VQNRLVWALAALVAAATLAAVGVGLNGYRNSPAPPARAAAVVPTDERDPMAPRLFDQAGTIRVHVAGAVRRPGVYSLPAWARVVDAVKKAGGAAADADLDGINLADFLKDGEQLRIPARGRRASLQAHRPAPEPPPADSGAGGHAPGRHPFAAASARAQPPGEPREGPPPRPVNLNTATTEQLDTLPGVGPATAERIVEHRRSQGPFLRPEDLMNVKGIGASRFEKMRPWVEAP
jgi:competence protein ComEA